MKKITLILALILGLSSASAWAIDLNKIADAVDSASSKDEQKSDQKKSGSSLAKLDDSLLNGVISKAEGRFNQIADKMENRVSKYEKKFDEYEGKISKAEKATDRIIKTMESFDSSKIQQIANMAKYAAIAVASVILLLIILLILVLIQLMRVSCLLKKTKDK